MGEVIRFPDETGQLRSGRYVDANTESATVIILPVVRIDRDPNDHDGQTSQPGNRSRRRRRRAAR
jgi:hypothetical protein